MFAFEMNKQLGDIEALATALRDPSASQVITEVLELWGVIYKSFVQRRFDTYSQGGGDWDPLASTRGRNLAAAGGDAELVEQAILRDTDTLFIALTPELTLPGGIADVNRFSITVGYGGGDSHPNADVTIAELARWHQEGEGNLPSRPIIVEPPQSVRDLMAKGLELAVLNLGNGD